MNIIILVVLIAVLSFLALVAVALYEARKNSDEVIRGFKSFSHYYAEYVRKYEGTHEGYCPPSVQKRIEKELIQKQREANRWAKNYLKKERQQRSSRRNY